MSPVCSCYAQLLILRLRFDNPLATVHTARSLLYEMELCRLVCSPSRVWGCCCCWSCEKPLEPWHLDSTVSLSAASSLFRHFILKTLRSNLKVTAHIGAGDSTLNRSCSQTIRRRSGVPLLKTVLSFLKAALVSVDLSSAREHLFLLLFPWTVMSYSLRALSISIAFFASVCWIFNTCDKHSLSCLFYLFIFPFPLRAWSVAIIPTAIVVDLGKHSCLAVPS